MESSSKPSRRSNWSGSTTTAHASRSAADEKPSRLKAAAQIWSTAVRSAPSERQPPTPPTALPLWLSSPPAPR